MKIDILGTSYKLENRKRADDPKLENANGYCDTSSKRLVVEDIPDHPMNLEDLEKFKQKVTRHEIIHAFLHESGLSHNSWADDEEIIDWIALQFPKMAKVFEEAKCMGD